MLSLYVSFGGPSCIVHTMDIKCLLFTLWYFCGLNSLLTTKHTMIRYICRCYNNNAIKLDLITIKLPSLTWGIEVARKLRRKCVFNPVNKETFWVSLLKNLAYYFHFYRNEKKLHFSKIRTRIIAVGVAYLTDIHVLIGWYSIIQLK